MRQLTPEQRELAEQNMSLARVAATVARYRLPSLGDEAESAAMIGVVLASRSFRPDGSATFRTYANRCIRGEIGRAIRSMTWKGRTKGVGHVRIETADRFDENRLVYGAQA